MFAVYHLTPDGWRLYGRTASKLTAEDWLDWLWAHGRAVKLEIES